jgi:hypothetical protein
MKVLLAPTARRAGGGLDDRARRREVATEDHSARVRLARVVARADDVVVVDLDGVKVAVTSLVTTIQPPYSLLKMK